MIGAGAIQVVAVGMPAELGVVVGGAADGLALGRFVGLALQRGDQIIHGLDVLRAKGHHVSRVVLGIGR